MHDIDNIRDIFAALAMLAVTAAAPAQAQHGPAHAPPAPSDARASEPAGPAPGTLFGEKVESYVSSEGDTVTAVGVVIPLAAIEAAPEEGAFGDLLVLDLPAAAKEQTFLSQLRVNWYGFGHGPAPYGEPHFDFHFHRGSSAEIDAISCGGAANFPAEILSPTQQWPTTCVSAMGYHAWPQADALPGATFTASLILGYTPSELVFIEPMITRATLLARRDFALTITPPAKSGARTPTRFPTRVRGIYEADGDLLKLEFDQLVTLP